MATTKTKKPARSRTKTMQMPSSMSETNIASETPTRKITYKYLTVFAVLLLLLGIAYLFKSLFVAAMVNGKPVSRLSVVKNLEKTGGKQALESLVSKELIMQEAKKNNVSVTQDEVNKEVESLSKSISDQGSTLDEALAMQGMTKADLEENVHLQLSVKKLLASKISVSDDEVKKHFEDNKATYEKNTKFEDMQSDIKSQLEQDKLATEFQNWYKELQSQAKIQYFVSY